MNNILSIIICCRNEIHTIEKILDKVNKLSLSHPWKKQVIIVDNCSTDGTRAILSKINREDTTIIFQEKNIGKGQCQSPVSHSNLNENEFLISRRS